MAGGICPQSTAITIGIVRRSWLARLGDRRFPLCLLCRGCGHGLLHLLHRRPLAEEGADQGGYCPEGGAGEEPQDPAVVRGAVQRARPDEGRSTAREAGAERLPHVAR